MDLPQRDRNLRRRITQCDWPKFDSRPLNVSYDGEQWRDAGNNDPQEGIVPFPQTMVFEYGFGATFSGVTTWHRPANFADFDFTSPVFTANQTALNGNNAANRTAGLGGTVSDLDWQSGTTLWLRWIEHNDHLVDHGLAIDNFSFSVTAVPEPSAVLFGGLVCSLLGLALLGRWVSRVAF